MGIEKMAQNVEPKSTGQEEKSQVIDLFLMTLKEQMGSTRISPIFLALRWETPFLTFFFGRINTFSPEMCRDYVVPLCMV